MDKSKINGLAQAILENESRQLNNVAKQIDDDIKSDEFQDAIDNFSIRRQGIHPNPFYLFIFFPICCE